MPEPCVFLDSSIVLSGLHSAKGAPGQILERFVRGDVTVVVSQQVLEEVVRTIKEKLPEALPALRWLLENRSPEVVTDPERQELAPWAKKLAAAEARIMAAAAAAKPDYFVTSDNIFLDDQDIAKEAELCIVTPSQLLGLLQRRRPPSRP